MTEQEKLVKEAFAWMANNVHRLLPPRGILLGGKDREGRDCPVVKSLSFPVETDHGTLNVVETVFQWGHPLLRKLAWCRNPATERWVDGFPNPIFHFNFCVTAEEDFEDYPRVEKDARITVRRSFMNYYNHPALKDHPMYRPLRDGDVETVKAEEPVHQTWRDREPLL